MVPTHIPSQRIRRDKRAGDSPSSPRDDAKRLGGSLDLLPGIADGAHLLAQAPLQNASGVSCPKLYLYPQRRGNYRLELDAVESVFTCFFTVGDLHWMPLLTVEPQHAPPLREATLSANRLVVEPVHLTE
jgi:hypothetical protein